MSSSTGKDSSKKVSSIDSLKFSSKTSNSSKHASSESVLSRKESLQLQECQRKLLGQVIIRDDHVALNAPVNKKIIMPIVVNPEELAASAPAQRNWRGILIALLVIAAVLALIVFSIVLLSPGPGAGGARGRRPTLQHLLSAQYKVVPFNGSWVSDSELVYRDQWGGLTLFNANNFTTRLLMNNSTFRELNAVDFKVSPDLRFVLLISDVRAGWRHGRLARYHVYDVIHRNRIPISPTEEDKAAPLLQYAEWSPLGGGLVFVHDNDIYYKPRVLKTLVCRITSTGVPGVIFNGVPDFLYETQVLRLERALWFSPDGQYLLYVTYNDTEVPEYKYPWYGLNDPEPPAYPTIRSVRYPQMGSINPVATLYVVSLKTPKFLFPHAIQFSNAVDKTWYLRWSSWVSERQVAVLLLSRPQNVSVISLCSATHYNCQDIVVEEAESWRWSGLGAEAGDEGCGWCGGHALVGGKAGLFTLSPVSEAAGAWRHAVRVRGGVKTPLTQGPFELTQLLGWDERRRYLYTIGTAPDEAGQRHLYRTEVPEENGQWPPVSTCLTCTSVDPSTDYTTNPEDEEIFDNMTSSLSSWPTSTVLPLTEDDNTTLPRECLYNRITFSTNFSYYVQECLGPGPPVTWLRAARGGRSALLSDGEPLASRVASLAQPVVKVFKVEIQNQRAARVRLFFPPGFRESDDLPLPLVLEMGGSPGSQLVTEQWSLQWAHYLAASRNTIVAQIDASGSGGQGEEQRTEIYQKLWTVDIEDQIAVLQFVVSRVRAVDALRVALVGRGEGGGAALAAAAAEPAAPPPPAAPHAAPATPPRANRTRCVAAIAPLAELTHNSYWSERYGGYGAARRGALAAAAAWRRAGALAPRRVLLARAAADLRHPPHLAARLTHALNHLPLHYTHLVYPDEDHTFQKSALHLYTSLDLFLDECFGPVELDDWDPGVGGLFPFRD